MDELGCEHIRHVVSYMLTENMSIGASEGPRDTGKLDDGGVDIHCGQCSVMCLLVLKRPGGGPAGTDS